MSLYSGIEDCFYCILIVERTQATQYTRTKMIGKINISNNSLFRQGTFRTGHFDGPR